jgi:ectoine hydroxylase-related dioxygenase (phytanoyl-CoA dioxygenase family)
LLENIELHAPPAPLSDDVIGVYERDGFVRLKEVFSPGLLQRYGHEITAEVARRNSQTRPLEERDTYHKAFLQVTNLWRTNEVVKAFVFGKRLATIAADLLRVNRVRLYHDQALLKEPGGGMTPWHADQYYWPLDSDKTITAWIPLQETPLAMGPLAFAAGSHRMTTGRDLKIGDDGDRMIRAALESAKLREDVHPFELGEVSFHSGWTFHHTAPNRTPVPRGAMTIIYMADGIRLTPAIRPEHEADRAAFMPGVEPGEVVDSELNPVLN